MADPLQLLNITHIFIESASPIENRNRQSSGLIHKAICDMAAPTGPLIATYIFSGLAYRISQSTEPKAHT